MFGFTRTKRDPLIGRKAADRWVAALPVNDPLAAHALILPELGRLAEREAIRTPASLEAVFRIDTCGDQIRDALTRQYLEHGPRSARVENQLWLALFDLTQSFLSCYQAFASEVATHPHVERWASLLPELMVRQMIHHGIEAKIRLYRYEQSIPAKWTDLHALFQLACSAQVERQSVAALPGGAFTSIEQEYLRVLMLQGMNSGNFMPRQIEWVAEQLTDWCAPLQLTIGSSSDTGFYVDLASHKGLCRRPAKPLEGRVLFVDTRPLHAALMQHVVMLEQKLRNDPLSERTPLRADQLHLYTKLAAQVDPEFRPLARRGERVHAHGRVDAILGFTKIAGFLRDAEMAPLVEWRPVSGTFGETLEIATFGGPRNETQHAIDVARRRLANYAAPGGPWEIRDVSRTGYRLVAPLTLVNAITLGTLAAIRVDDQKTWTIGIVRRMKRMTTERAEIGLQVIATNLAGVELTEPKRGDTDYSVDGQTPTVNGRRFSALFLSLEHRGSGQTVQTLIVPAGEYQSGKRLHMSIAHSSHRIAFGRLLEQHPEWIWATVDALDSSDRATVAPKRKS